MITLLVALGVALAPERPGRPTQPARFAMSVDSSRRQLVLTLGPYDLATEPDMPMMDMQEMEDHSPRFVWPANTWLRAYHVRVTDAQGHPLPSSLLHHFALVDFDRRDLVYPIVDRVFGGGEETGDVSLPVGIAVPVRGGDHIGFYFMWHNETGTDLTGVTLRIAFTWTPRNEQPAPQLVVPFWVDVNYHAGDDNTYPAPPGGVVKTCVFSFPVSGHLLAAGAHLHPWGASVRLEDSATGRVIANVGVDHAPDGKLPNVSRRLFGIWGMGPHLEAGRRYRVVAVYDNPTDSTLTGLMGILGGLFAPDHPEQWPALDRNDSTYLRDLSGFLMADQNRPTPITIAGVR
ncbi:MAG TPA: hypothetical protein VEV39_14545 [Gemmatimonadales bacterium]|nr:hypothetical protein [Gemmatimonadales bacterium]